MKLKEIEKMLNDYIATDEVKNKEMTYGECQNIVISKLIAILKPMEELLETVRINASIYGNYGEKGNVYLDSYLLKRRNFPSLITFKIHRKKGPGRVSIWSSYATYFIKDVELELNGYDFETIEDIIDYVKEQVKARKESEDNKLKNFINQLDEFDLQFCEFRKLLDLYNYLNYDQKAELEKQLKEV